MGGGAGCGRNLWGVPFPIFSLFPPLSFFPARAPLRWMPRSPTPCFIGTATPPEHSRRHSPKSAGRSAKEFPCGPLGWWWPLAVGRRLPPLRSPGGRRCRRPSGIGWRASSTATATCGRWGSAVACWRSPWGWRIGRCWGVSGGHPEGGGAAAAVFGAGLQLQCLRRSGPALAAGGAQRPAAGGGAAAPAGGALRPAGGGLSAAGAAGAGLRLVRRLLRRRRPTGALLAPKLPQRCPFPDPLLQIFRQPDALCGVLRWPPSRPLWPAGALLLNQRRRRNAANLCRCRGPPLPQPPQPPLWAAGGLLRPAEGAGLCRSGPPPLWSLAGAAAAVGRPGPGPGQGGGGAGGAAGGVCRQPLWAGLLTHSPKVPQRRRQRRRKDLGFWGWPAWAGRWISGTAAATKGNFAGGQRRAAGGRWWPAGPSSSPPPCRPHPAFPHPFPPSGLRTAPWMADGPAAVSGGATIAAPRHRRRLEPPQPPAGAGRLRPHLRRGRTLPFLPFAGEGVVGRGRAALRPGERRRHRRKWRRGCPLSGGFPALL